MEAIKRVRLSEIAELITKGTTPTTLGYNFQEDGVNFLKIECFSEDGTYIKEKTAHISEECHEKLKRSKLRTGDILFSIAGAIGRVAVVTEEMLPANTNQALAIIRVTRDDIYLPYIKLILTSQIVKAQFERKKQGVAQLNISLKDINELEIPLPEKSKQIECASLLEKISGIITARQKQLQKLDELVKARFVELFGDMFLNSMHWDEKSLDSMADVVSGITKGRKVKEQNLLEVPYMAVSNVKDGYIDWTTVKTIEATEQEINQYRLLPDDVLMTEGGDPDKLGRGAIIKKPLENCIHQNHIFRVRLNESVILPSFFAEYLKHQKAKRYFLGCAKQTTGIASINMRQLKALPVLLPPLQLQRQFSVFVEQTDKSKAAVQKALDETQLLFDSLMQKYFG